MDGSVFIYNAQTGSHVAHLRCHQKYCVRARWLPGQASHRFVTASWDATLAVHEIQGQLHECMHCAMLVGSYVYLLV